MLKIITEHNINVSMTVSTLHARTLNYPNIFYPKSENRLSVTCWVISHKFDNLSLIPSDLAGSGSYQAHWGWSSLDLLHGVSGNYIAQWCTIAMHSNYQLDSYLKEEKINGCAGPLREKAGFAVILEIVHPV